MDVRLIKGPGKREREAETAWSARGGDKRMQRDGRHNERDCVPSQLCVKAMTGR